MYSITFEIIHLKEDSYHIGLEGSINEHACRILIDTGASKSVLDKSYATDIAESLKLVDTKDLSSGLGTSTMKVEIADIETLKIGDFILNGWQIAVIDLAHVNQAYQEVGLGPVNMVLGNDILVKHQASIDYTTKILLLN